FFLCSFFYRSCKRQHLKTFPTRRSSDLEAVPEVARLDIVTGRSGGRRDQGDGVIALADGLVQRLGELDRSAGGAGGGEAGLGREDRKSTRLNSSHVKISYAVFRLNKKMN